MKLLSEDSVTKRVTLLD